MVKSGLRNPVLRGWTGKLAIAKVSQDYPRSWNSIRRMICGVKASASCGRPRDIVVVQTGCCVLDYCGVDRPLVVDVR